MNLMYNQEYLKEKGFNLNINLEDTINGLNINYLYDSINNITFFQNIPLGHISEIVSELKKVRNYEYFWFWNDSDSGGRLIVFRTYGENRLFIFNQKRSLHAEDYIKSKIAKLKDFSPKNFSILFDVKDIVSLFYKQLWEIRINLAKSINITLPDRDRILIAQRFIDRLIFVYFLVEMKIIFLKNPKGSKINFTAGKFFKTLIKDDEFYIIIKKIFDYLNSNNNDLLLNDSKYSIYIPFLSGGLFRNRLMKCEDGSEIYENEIIFENYEWSSLIETFSNYNWMINEYKITSIEDEYDELELNYNLTPEILGYIYEKFVIAISKIDDIEIDNLSISHNGELRKKNKEIGAYYTPGEITTFISEKAIFSKAKKLMPEISNSISDFNTFFVKYQDNPEVLTKFNDILLSVTILDPAVGSGHFLMSAADTIYNWSYKCNPKLDDYTIRKSIIINQLYGVDLMDGAVDICKLRLWLWLISNNAPFEMPEPLPNIDFNIRQGNSLLGFANKVPQETIISVELKHLISDYLKGIKQYKTENLGADKLKKDLDCMYNEIKPIFDRYYAFYLNYKVRKTFMNFVDFSTLIDKIKMEDGEITKTKISLIFEFNQNMNVKTKSFLIENGFSLKGKKAIYSVHPRSVDYNKIKEIIIKLEMYDIREKYVEHIITTFDLKNNSAFHWFMEFPEIYPIDGKIGFDIIIGNPPYIGFNEILPNDRLYYQHFKIYKGKADIFYYFIERIIELGDINSILSFITTNYWFKAQYADSLRKFLIENIIVKEIIDFVDIKVFSGLGNHCCIFFFDNVKPAPNDYDVLIRRRGSSDKQPIDVLKGDKYTIDSNQLTELIWTLSTKYEESILEKIEKKSEKVYPTFNIDSGIMSALQKIYLIDFDLAKEIKLENKIARPCLKNSEINKFGYVKPKLIGLLVSKNTNFDNFPNVKRYLMKNKELINKRNRKRGEDLGLGLARSKEHVFKSKIKIYGPFRSNELKFALISDNTICSDDCVIISSQHSKDVYLSLLGYLNSKAINFYFKKKTKIMGNIINIRPNKMKEFLLYGRKGIDTNLVELLMTSMKENNSENFNKLYNKLNMTIYQEFSLTKDEIKYIENQN